MKIKAPALTLTLSLVLAATSLAGTTAKQAISVLKTAEGSNVANNIISLTGRFGQDQPNEWEILARRGNEFAMFIVDNKSVISVSKVRPKSPVRLATDLIKIDTDKAFRTADKSAKSASIGFDSLNYELRPRSDNPTPVWIVTLADANGINVGEIHVASDSGTVLRTNWDREQLNRPALATAPSTGSTRGILADRRTSTQTGTTADGVRDGIATVSSSIRNAFRREVSSPDQSKGPATTKIRPTGN